MTDSPKDQDTEQNQTGTDDAWAEALAEQAAAEQDTAAESTADDDASAAWAEAMAEQAEAETAAEPRAADDTVFRPFADESARGTPRDLDMIMEIPVTLSVELGSTRLSIRELLDLAKGSIVELDGLAGEPMDILINGYLVAQGEVVVVEDKYGIRITDIVDRAERIGKLNR
ncbi:flagellar motor switch protein FliN [Salinisphaera hydrothermalis]|uniref:Flagellar motor switch protein FliN n=1 Tax=Salinisphaera hydrothermalis (strain C41B8) TaxID=1304275 RepID=A0A084IMT6_SALHC|nr:flagellar motor switch FliN [Salinisphaera hydrothermalis C41B8]